MEHNNLFGPVKEDLQKIDYLSEKLLNNPEIPEIELDIILEKIRHLYNYMLDIKLGRIKKQSIPEPIRVKLEEPAPTYEISKELDFEVTREIHNSTPPVEKIAESTKIEPQTIQPEKEEKIIVDTVKQTQTIKVEAPSLAESLIKKNTSLNDAFAKSKPEVSNFSSAMQNSPINNLKSAIGVNDKFLFIRELFMGDADLYNQTIDILNNAADFNEAFNYVDSKFSWKRDNPVTQKLFELLRRKYISGKN